MIQNNEVALEWQRRYEWEVKNILASPSFAKSMKEGVASEAP